MQLKLTRKRAMYLTKLIKAGIEYLEKTEKQDPIDIIKAGEGILKEIRMNREDLANTATIKKGLKYYKK